MYSSVTDFIPPNSPFFHIALIPDGSRRWARCNNTTYKQSYTIMCSKIADLIDYLYSNDVDIVSVFLSSNNNFKRDEEEILAFCEAERFFIDDLLPLVARKYNVRVEAVGNTEDMYYDFKMALDNIVQKTKLFHEKKLFLCIKYSSLQEIEKANHIYHDHANGQRSCYVNFLDIPYPVNILVRTGDANVLSDFLLPQCASARLFFLNTLFNDLSQNDIAEILREYNQYELKYGE